MVKRDRRIDIHLSCYLLVEQTGYLLQTTTINVSKGGMLVRSLKPLETGQEVLCLLSDKKNLTRLAVMHDNNTMKGRIVRVERQEILYRMAIQITWGRVNPVAHLETEAYTKFWWTRHWQ